MSQPTRPLPYANIDMVRRLAGNVPLSDMTDADIAEAINYSDDQVDSETSRVGEYWSTTDPSFFMVKAASEYFASAWIIDHYYPSEKADAHYMKGMDLCTSIRESSPGSIIVVSSQYRTFPLNPRAKMYRSLPGAADASNSRIAFGDDRDAIG